MDPNQGITASTYDIIERLILSWTPQTNIRVLLEILASASSEHLPAVKPTLVEDEDKELRRLNSHQRFQIKTPARLYSTEPKVKAGILLQAHLSRQTVSGTNLIADQREVVDSAAKFLEILVEALSINQNNNGRLDLALLAMEFSQMVKQSMWEDDSPLLQIPHLTRELAAKWPESDSKHSVSAFFSRVPSQKAARELLQVGETEYRSMQTFFWERYPSMKMAYKVAAVKKKDDDVAEVTLRVELENPFKAEVDLNNLWNYTEEAKEGEGWWVVVGDKKRNRVVAIKRVPSFQKKEKLKLKFKLDSPDAIRSSSYMLYLKSDTFWGCDKECPLTLTVGETQWRPSTWLLGRPGLFGGCIV